MDVVVPQKGRYCGYRTLRESIFGGVQELGGTPKMEYTGGIS